MSAESVKQLNIVNEERRGITYFNSLWLNKGNELEMWLIWLLYNDVENAYDNIVKRLCIVILYFKNDISNVIGWLNKNKLITTLDKIVLNNPSSEHKLTEHYNSIIKNIIRDSGKILIKSQGGRKAPKKMPKQPTKAPKKTPKQPTKTPKQPTKPTKQPTKTPKQPTKTPKQPTKPPKQPTKTPKQPTKPTKQPKETKQPKVALKAPKKTPKVARKTNKKK